MRVTLTNADGSHDASPQGDRVEVHDVTCAGCHAPLCARGAKMRIESHDTYAADAYCVSCAKPCGTLRVVVSTIFGLEEDEAVLYRGRCRVY